MSDDNGNTTSGEYEDEIAMLRDLCCRQSARIERLTAENKQLRAVADAAARVRPTEHRGGWQDYVPGLMELKQALAALEETTE